MNRHEKHLRTLWILAQDVERVGNARIAAGIVVNNDLVAVGINERRYTRLQGKFKTHPKQVCVHAEIAAIAAASKKGVKVDGATLYIARAKKASYAEQHKWLFGIARPCPSCMKAIYAFNIKKVYYTIDLYGYEEL